MTVGLLGWGLLAPEGTSLRVERIGDEGDAKTKRLPRLDRMCLQVAREAMAGRNPAGVALVFGTGYGALAATVDVLEGMATRGPAFASPGAFHQSVHHAPAGQLSIALGLKAACLTTSAREVSGESALRIGFDLLASGRAQRVLVVAGDEWVPALMSAYRAFGVLAADGKPGVTPGEGAAAVLLGKDEGAAVSLGGCALTAHPVSSLRFASDVGPLTAWLRETMPASVARVSAGAAEPGARTTERAALRNVFPEAIFDDDGERFGLNPSGGLLRLVTLAQRLSGWPQGTLGVVHGLSLGGGQAAVALQAEG